MVREHAQNPTVSNKKLEKYLEEIVNTGLYQIIYTVEFFMLYCHIKLISLVNNYN